MQINHKQHIKPESVPAAPVHPFPAATASEDPFAQAPAPAESAEPTAEQRFLVPVDGEMQELTLDALTQAASLGLSKQNAYIRRNRVANGMPNGQIYASFVEEYPHIEPSDIPPQVWEWAEQEGSLVSAYRKWEILELKDELAALQMNQKNRQAAVGTAQSDGEPTGVDPRYARASRKVNKLYK